MKDEDVFFLLPNDHHIRFSMMMIMKQDHGYHLPLGRKMENFFRKKERMLAVYTRVWAHINNQEKKGVSPSSSLLMASKRTINVKTTKTQ